MLKKTPEKPIVQTESAPKPAAKKKPFHLVLGIVLLGLGIWGVFNGVNSLFDNSIRMIVPNGVITVEVVDTPELRRMGLSGREAIKDSEGMLFEFATKSSDNCFWMKDMQFSIDMVWLNDEKQVVTVEKDVSPETFPESFCPTEPVLYGLEITSGQADKLGIELGESLRW